MPILEMPEDKKYISLQEAADYSGIYSQEYLSLRARQKKLKAVKLGRNWVTTKKWLEEYIKKTKAEKWGSKEISFHQTYRNPLTSGLKKLPEIKPYTKSDTLFRSCQFLYNQSEGALLDDRCSKDNEDKNIHVLNISNNKPFKKNKSLFSEFAAILVIAGFVIGAAFLLNPQNNNLNFQKKQAWFDSIINPMKENFSSVFSGAYRIKEGLLIVSGKAVETLNSELWERRTIQLVLNRISDFFSYLSGKSKALYLFVKGNVFKNNNSESSGLSFSGGSSHTIGKADSGIIVMPSSGEKQDRDIKSKIQDSFSDEIIVEPSDDNSGVIVPVFEDKLGDRYLYMMVPTKN